jgi:EmrB/QacA subfamily drug resistance transporter
MAMLVLDSSIVGIMLPSMTTDLGLTSVEQTWTVTAYLLTLAVLLPIGGRLVDMIGPARGFAAGMAGFAGSSLVIGLAQGPHELIAARGCAGVAAAVLMPATLALIFAAFPPDGRAKAMAIYTGAGQAFATVGPACGGLCAEFLTWRWGFLINVPIGAVGVAFMMTARPEHTPHLRSRWDGVGTVALLIGLSGVSFGLVQVPAWGIGSPAVLGALGIGLASTAFFVRHCLRRSDTLLDLTMFKVRTFAGSTVLLACLGFSMTVITIYPAISLQTALSLTPATAGLALLPLVIPLLLATRWAGRRFNDVGPRVLGVWGSAAMAAGAVVVAGGIATTSTWLLCCGLVPAGVGIGLLLSPMTTTAIGAVSESARGQASGLSSMLRQFGGILGIATFGIVASATTAARDGTALGFVFTAALMVVAAVVAATVLRSHHNRSAQVA